MNAGFSPPLLIKRVSAAVTIFWIIIKAISKNFVVILKFFEKKKNAINTDIDKTI
jgi:hypothetical protein